MHIIAANWKMNKTIKEAGAFLDALKKTPIKSGRQVIIAPVASQLALVAESLKGTSVKISAQNMYFAEKGAFTGELSPVHVKEAGATHVIIGHSERRKIFGETGELLAKKLLSAFQYGLVPIFCIGETKEERDGNSTFSVLESQISEGLAQLSADKIQNIIFAYEPVWAIGTGVNATPDQAGEAHRFIAEFIQKKYFKNSPSRVTILYGGSVTPENMSSLMSKPAINGALVGGASLNVDSFTAIVNF